jgi:hypothetical protein
MIKIYQAKDIIEAQIISAMLGAYGIEARADGQYLQGGMGDLAAMDFASVSVEDEDINAARELLMKYERGELGLDDRL